MIAYRSLGKLNYHFAAIEQPDVHNRQSVEAMWFDVKGACVHEPLIVLVARAGWIDVW